MSFYRHCDPRFPFLWESDTQPPARWHGPGQGPVQYLADTPDGAWSEFLRHEAITDEDDLRGIDRDLWVVDLPAPTVPAASPSLPNEVLHGGLDSYGACQAEAQRLRDAAADGLVAPSAALLPGEARGWRAVGGRLQAGPDREGRVVVLFGSRPHLVGWCACARGRPSRRLLPKVRHLSSG